MAGQSEARIENGKKANLSSILADILDGDLQCLYFAKEDQIDKLIDQGKISEDYASYWQDYQEEMRCMMNDAAAEFNF